MADAITMVALGLIVLLATYIMLYVEPPEGPPPNGRF